MGIGQPVARTEVEALAVPQAPRCGRLRDQNTPTDAIAATSCVRDSGRREPAATEQSTSSRPGRPLWRSAARYDAGALRICSSSGGGEGMAQFQHGDVAINYEVSGAGFPLLLIAPGGMNSSIDWWSRAALDPLAVYADDFQLIAMDQRNAGASTGPLDVQDPWGSYIDDQLGL